MVSEKKFQVSLQNSRKNPHLLLVLEYILKKIHTMQFPQLLQVCNKFTLFADPAKILRVLEKYFKNHNFLVFEKIEYYRFLVCLRPLKKHYWLDQVYYKCFYCSLLFILEELLSKKSLLFLVLNIKISNSFP